MDLICPRRLRIKVISVPGGQIGHPRGSKTNSITYPRGMDTDLICPRGRIEVIYLSWGYVAVNQFLSKGG